MSYALEAGRLRIRRSMTRRPGRLPASAYGEWILLLRHLDNAEAAQVKLRRRG